MGGNLTPMKPVSKDLLYTKIADAIVDYIKENKLQTGDKIPSERDLAAQLATSRNSVREAIRVLENEHVIEVKTGKGAYVTEIMPEDSVYVKLWKVNYGEILEIKYLLEKRVIEKLCDEISEEKLTYIEEPLLELEEAAARGEFSQNTDYIFHKRIRKTLKNATMEQMIDNLISALDAYGKDVQGFDNIWVTTIPYHRRLFEAIKNKDFSLAEKACTDIYEIDRRALKSIEIIRNETD